ncbi:MAG: 4-hydroxythreonine-4-phosphate dehydrogenase PdxA, partial [Victivallaceae bacterium]|nr:4-hydroxythreonine-4-phosphate dehydrogenase PdxA [Victivallaceae bacterium]
MALPLIAVSAGDPAGIGYELTVRCVCDPGFAGRARFVVYGAADVLREAVCRWGGGSEVDSVDVSSLKWGGFTPGEAAAACGRCAYDGLSAAARDVLAGRADALVTAPTNKFAVNLAGIPFTGHTERLAELCRCQDYVMMQSAGTLRMVFVTCHVPLADVSRLATRSE